MTFDKESLYNNFFETYKNNRQKETTSIVKARLKYRLLKKKIIKHDCLSLLQNNLRDREMLSLGLKAKEI